MKYSVKCSGVENGSNGVIGMASIVIEDKFAINSIRLVQRDDAYAVHYPSRKSAKSESGYQTIAFPADKALAASIREAIIVSYNAGGDPVEINSLAKFNLEAYVTPYEKENLKGIANVKFSDNNEFKVNDIVIRDGRNGLYVDMPSYKKKDETYASVMNPVTKEFYEEFTTKLLDAYEKKISGQKKTCQGEDIGNNDAPVSGSFRHKPKSNIR